VLGMHSSCWLGVIHWQQGQAGCCSAAAEQVLEGLCRRLVTNRWPLQHAGGYRRTYMVCASMTQWRVSLSVIGGMRSGFAKCYDGVPAPGTGQCCLVSTAACSCKVC
jgi:hypothetical protein